MGNEWRYLGGTIREQRVGVAGAVLSGLGWQGAAILAPLVVRYGVDQGIRAHDRTHLIVAAAGLVALGLAESVCGALRHYFAIRNRGRGQASVRDRIFRHALELDAGYHDRVGAGELMSRASNDAELVARLLDAMGHTVGYVLTIFGVSVVLLLLDPVLALVVLVPLPVIAFGFWRYSSRYAERTRLLQQELANATTLVEESVAGVRVVKGLGAGPALEQRFRRQSDRVVQRALDVASVDAVFLPLLELLPLLAILAVLWFGARRTLEGHITIGTLIAFTQYVLMLVWPMRVIGQRVGTLQQAAAAARRVVEVLRARPKIVERPDARNATLRGHVRFDGVRFAYGGGPPALDGVSLVIEPGEHLALVGATGAGKSTLAKLITRQYDPGTGRVTFGGVDLRAAREQSLRSRIVFLPQEGHLFAGSIADNVRLARPGASDVEVDAALARIGARERFARLPGGIGTDVQTRGVRLSSGERQLIALARAALVEPAVVVLDEATSSLDPGTERDVERAIAAVSRGRTVITIAHRLSTAERADRVALLEHGRLVEIATHDELVAQGARYAALWASWQAGLEEARPPVTVEHAEGEREDEPARRAARPQDEPRGERV